MAAANTLLASFFGRSRPQKPKSTTARKNGYQWIPGNRADLRFCAVSDASADDLSALKSLLSPLIFLDRFS